MLINVFTWNLTWTFAVPLFPLYFIHVLGWSDVWIGAFGAASGLGVVLGCILSARLVRENSPMGIIRPAATLTGLLPLLLMASSASSLIVLTAFVVNAAWACVDLLTLTTTLELSPEGKRMAHVGWYMAALSAGSFVGPLLGVAVVARLDYTVAFMVAAILRFGAAGLFWLDGLKFFTWRRVLGQMALWAIAPVVIGLVCILVLISYGLDKGASLWR